LMMMLLLAGERVAVFSAASPTAERPLH